MENIHKQTLEQFLLRASADRITRTIKASGWNEVLRSCANKIYAQQTWSVQSHVLSWAICSAHTPAPTMVQNPCTRASRTMSTWKMSREGVECKTHGHINSRHVGEPICFAWRTRATLERWVASSHCVLPTWPLLLVRLASWNLSKSRDKQKTSFL